MTSIFTFPCGNATTASTSGEAAGYLCEIFGKKFNPRRAKKSEEPDDEEFYAKYGEPENHGETITGNPQLLETYGHELEKIIQIAAKTPKQVWTLIDGDDGISRLVAGLHTVNRINYLTTKKPWESEDETYIW